MNITNTNTITTTSDPSGRKCQTNATTQSPITTQCPTCPTCPNHTEGVTNQEKSSDANRETTVTGKLKSHTLTTGTMTEVKLATIDTTCPSLATMVTVTYVKYYFSIMLISHTTPVLGATMGLLLTTLAAVTAGWLWTCWVMRKREVTEQNQGNR